MATMAHTPRPWIVGGESNNMGEAEIIETSFRTIAWTASSLNDFGEEILTEEDRANGVLMAAAPDLLAALENIVEGIKCAESVSGLEAHALLVRAEEAIAEAKGREHHG
jgi:hypothetical protein